jgi:predicted TIM-barrel fold metal-dependent hydrolase
MELLHPVDSHVHIGDAHRVEELRRYVRLLGLERIGCISLPTVGADAAVPTGDVASSGGAGTAGRPSSGGPEIGSAGRLINFNPEVLLAMHALPGVADGFGSFDNRGLLEPAAGSRAAAKTGWAPAAQVAAMYEAGFAGIKMWEGKPDLQAALGIILDDPRFIEAYREAGHRGMPLLIHVADPEIFWERQGGPWSYVGRPVPSFDELIRQAEAICEKAGETTFIFPHLLFLADDPSRMSRFVEEHPNAYLDLAPGNYFYPALGAAESVGSAASPRRREEALAFFETHASRIILGSDSFFLPRDLALLPGTPLTDNLERYLRLRRFLGTRECFATPFGATAEETPLIGGLGLRDELLQKIGGENYLKLMGPPRRLDRVAAGRYLEQWGAGEPEAEARAASIAERIAELAGA